MKEQEEHKAARIAMKMEKPVLSLHRGKQQGLDPRPKSQISSVGLNNATHDSNMSIGGDTKSQNKSIADSQTNRDLNDFLKMAREANSSSQGDRMTHGNEMKHIADKANIRF